MKSHFDLFGRPLFVQASFERDGWAHELPNGNTHHHWLTLGRRESDEAPGARLVILIIGPALFRFGWGQRATPAVSQQEQGE